MVGRLFLSYIILEVNSNSEEEVASFSVNLINKIAEAVFISNLKRQELIGCCHTSLPSDVECVGAFHVIFCNEEACTYGPVKRPTLASPPLTKFHAPFPSSCMKPGSQSLHPLVT